MYMLPHCEKYYTQGGVCMLGGYKTYTDYSSSNYDIKKAADSLKSSSEKKESDKK